MGVPAHRGVRAWPGSPSSSPSARSAPIPSSRRCRSGRTTSGTAIPRKPTRPTAWPRRCCSCSAQAYRQQYGFNVDLPAAREPLRAGRQLRSRHLARHPGAHQEVRRGGRDAAAGDRGLGHGQRDARVPLRRGRRRGHRAGRASATTAPSRSTWAPAARSRSATWSRLIGRADGLHGRDRLGRHQARRPAAALPRHLPGGARFGFRGHDELRGGAAADIAWYRATAGGAIRRLTCP